MISLITMFINDALKLIIFIMEKQMRLKICYLIIIGVLCNASIAGAVTFNFIYDSGMDQAALDGFIAAGNQWSSVLNNNVTVNIDIGFSSSLPSNVLADTSDTMMSTSYSAFKTALTADQTSANDATAVSHLQSGSSLSLLINYTSNNPNGSGSATPYLNSGIANNTTTINMTNANAKAVGLLSGTNSAVDASIIFNSTFNYTFNQSNGIAANTYDFMGIAEHEIGHALGFISGVDILDTNSPNPSSRFFPSCAFTYVSPLDLFRFSTLSASYGNVIDWTADTRLKFFSIDGGQTALLNGQFSTGEVHGDGYQASHWKDNLGLGIMDPTTAAGELTQISSLDLAAMDVIGWDLETVPEPSTMLLLGAGIGCLVLWRRKVAGLHVIRRDEQ